MFKHFGDMAIADRVQVRRLAGNRGENIISNATIDTAILGADAFVKAYTQNYGWQPTDPDYASIKEASEFLASHNVRSAFPDEDDEAEEQKDWALQILKAVVERVGGLATGGQVNIRTRPYRTNPMNPNAPYHRGVSYLEGGESLSIVD